MIATDADRTAVHRVVELAATTDAPGWLLTEIRGAAALAVAEARAEGRQEIIDCAACLPHDPCKHHGSR